MTISLSAMADLLTPGVQGAVQRAREKDDRLLSVHLSTDMRGNQIVISTVRVLWTRAELENGAYKTRGHERLSECLGQRIQPEGYTLKVLRRQMRARGEAAKKAKPKRGR